MIQINYKLFIIKNGIKIGIEKEKQDFKTEIFPNYFLNIKNQFNMFQYILF